MSCEAVVVALIIKELLDQGKNLAKSMESAITPKKGPGPLLGTIWWVLTVVIVAIVAYSIDSNVYSLLLGYRSVIALMGYLVMQIALWFAEFKWDEMGSAAYLEVKYTKITKLALISCFEYW